MLDEIYVSAPHVDQWRLQDHRSLQSNGDITDPTSRSSSLQRRQRDRLPAMRVPATFGLDNYSHEVEQEGGKVAESRS